jgi:hypothetical protein
MPKEPGSEAGLRTYFIETAGTLIEERLKKKVRVSSERRRNSMASSS